MDFKALLHNIKIWLKRRIRKIKKFFRKYWRRLVRHTKHGDYSLLIYTITAVIAFILLIVLFGKIIASGNKNSSGTKTSTATDSSVESTENTEHPVASDTNETASVTDAAPERVPVSQEELIKKAKSIYESNADLLILVNADNELSDDYTFEQHELNCGEIINALAYDDLCDMLEACNDAGYEYNIISGYRSRDDQQQVFDEDVSMYTALGYTEDEAKAIVNKTVQSPGYSEHETGLSLDISSEGNWTLDDSLKDDKTYIWLSNHCEEYGFILRYPTDKADITGIDYEPWHFRYVGKEAAMLMYNNNLTLEEFYELLN